jgi:CheY-like chemotaxis protein
MLMLRRLGYKADAVTNGLDALDALEAGTYDLVLMDILMPKMDGLTAAEEIRRRWPISKQPRIIAYTAYIYPGNEGRNLLKNMDSYLYKPIKIEDLRAVVLSNIWILYQQRKGAKSSSLEGNTSIP